jgi:hypothetical protein
LWILTLTGLCGAGIWGGYWRQISAAAATKRTVTPFTAQLHTKLFDEQGQLTMVVEKRTVYVSTDGTEMDVRNIRDSENQAHRLIKPNGFYAGFVPAVGAIMSGHLSKQHAGLQNMQREVKRSNRCAVPGKSEWIREESMLGVRVSVIEHKLSEHHRDISWAAPDLDCFLLKLSREENWDGTWRTRALTEATSVKIGPVDPSKFEIPAGLNEMAPSVMERHYMERMGQAIPPDAATQYKWAKKDQGYFERRSNPPLASE